MWIVPTSPRLREKMTGMIATSTVNSLTEDETRLSSAIGASFTRLAQLKAVTFSGNSERNGAIHWRKKKTDPAPSNRVAILAMESTKGPVITRNNSHDKVHRKRIEKARTRVVAYYKAAR